jgi:hypothetical protein
VPDFCSQLFSTKITKETGEEKKHFETAIHSYSTVEKV